MLDVLTQELLKYLGLLATTWMSGNGALVLERVPANVVVSPVAQAKSGFFESERVELYRLLAHDQRSEVRARLKGWLTRNEQLTELRQLAEDEHPDVQTLTASALREKLQRAQPEDQTGWATLFALALKPGPRLTLANALNENVPGETDYLYVLANDANIDVREAAVDATLTQLHKALAFGSTQGLQDALKDVLESRLHDPVPAIRKMARRGFVRASTNAPT